jgi:dolichol-phosphate mannosyltransferase
MAGETPKVSVVIPTFREAANLVVLMPRVAEVLEQAGLAAEIIVIDDDSRDGTPTVCQELARRHPVRLITRTNERGLATAVIRGLREARGDVLAVMDADLSHPPEALPRLVAAACEPATDFVIGSRYVAGGAIDQSWSLYRRLNSSGASLLARGLTSARDPMAGFFALRRTTFERAAELQPLGYKIGLELMVRCRCRRVVEIPIEFQDRLRGESKLSLTQQALYLRHLGRLYAFKLVDLWRALIRKPAEADLAKLPAGVVSSGVETAVRRDRAA